MATSNVSSLVEGLIKQLSIFLILLLAVHCEDINIHYVNTRYV